MLCSTVYMYDTIYDSHVPLQGHFSKNIKNGKHIVLGVVFIGGQIMVQKIVKKLSKNGQGMVAGRPQTI